MNRLFRNRVLLTLDLVVWPLLPVLALALRLDGFEGTVQYHAVVLPFIALSVLIKFLTLFNVGIYRRYWGYASIDELVLIITSVATASVITAAIYWIGAALWVVPVKPLPRSVPILDAMLTLLYVGGSRFAVRLAFTLRRRMQGRAAGKPVLLIGAGEVGAMIARDLRSNPQLRLDPVGFLDDDPHKRAALIQGLPVLGTHAELESVASGYGVKHAIITMPNAPGSVIREIRDRCANAGLEVKTVPAVHDILTGRLAVSQIRSVQIDDLLRREPVVTDHAAVADLLDGMTVVVTGAGGSVGSELCRQIARFNARRLVLLGHGENSIFEIHNELVRRFPDLDLIPAIADVRNGDRIRRIFETYMPQAVFHAAAHKHVPLMEANPLEAVTNNVAGTLRVVEAAEAVGVSHFVFISTDKAVNPANVMGATKLIAEGVVHDAAERTGAVYVSVRFGNVLGSRGSVVPLFQRQIAGGGPVTVTHPEMTRYFMTIPEAVELVLQASAMGTPGQGETFVLDMGEPVKILQLARDMIRLSGLEEGKDIEIRFTGLRPGEKMFEELFLDSELFGRTGHEKVYVAKNGRRPGGGLRCSVDKLIQAAWAGDLEVTRQCLVELVPTLTERPAGQFANALSPKPRLVIGARSSG